MKCQVLCGRVEAIDPRGRLGGPVTVCDRCGSSASLGAYDLDPTKLYSVHGQCGCTSFPPLPEGWEWRRVKGYLYVALSPDTLARQRADRERLAVEAAARQRAVDEQLAAQRQAAQAQRDFYMRGKGARTRYRTARALVDLFAAIKAWCEAVVRSQLVTRQELIANGWSAAEIARLLGEPDKIEYWRKYGHGSGERHLYERSRIATADHRRGERIKLTTSRGCCVLVIGRNQHVWIEPAEPELGEVIELSQNVADALVAVVMSKPRPIQPWWRRKLVELLEYDAPALSRLAQPRDDSPTQGPPSSGPTPVPASSLPPASGPDAGPLTSMNAQPDDVSTNGSTRFSLLELD